MADVRGLLPYSSSYVIILSYVCAVDVDDGCVVGYGSGKYALLVQQVSNASCDGG
jgi:hypothetical protein